MSFLSENKETKCRIANKAYSALIFLFCLITSCSFEKETGYLFYDTGKTMYFPVKQGAIYVQGIKKDSNDVFIFVDYRTRKEITFYNKEGLLHNAINFDSLCSMEGRYFKDCYVSDGNIILLTEKNNHVIVLNADGLLQERYFYDDMRNILEQEFSPILYLQDSILYVSTTSYKRNMGINLTEGIVWCDNWKDTNGMRNVVDSFYSRFLSNYDVAVEFPHFYILDSMIIITSYYSDSVYCYNLKGVLDSAFCVKSDFFSTKINPVTGKMLIKDDNAINHNLWNNSWIEKIIYDKYQGLFYCFICGPQKEKKYRDFSIVVYDDKFSPIFEQMFDGKKYASSCYVNESGLYLMKTDSKYCSFSLFTIK